jgi:hypothetical protein
MLYLALAFHKLAAKVHSLVGRCDQPLQGRRTWAIRAPSHRYWTI